MPTEVHLPLLDRVRIASPCSVKWEDMTGDATTRHCAQCNLSVFNLSNMSREEAETLLQSKVDNPSMRLCAGFFRRADGTILMKDCPVGLRAARMRAAKVTGRIAAALGFMVFGTVAAASTREDSWRGWGWSMKLRDLQPLKAVAGWLCPPPPQTMFLAGDICVPTAPPQLEHEPQKVGPRPEW